MFALIMIGLEIQKGMKSWRMNLFQKKKKNQMVFSFQNVNHRLDLFELLK